MHKRHEPCGIGLIRVTKSRTSSNAIAQKTMSNFTTPVLSDMAIMMVLGLGVVKDPAFIGGNSALARDTGTSRKRDIPLSKIRKVQLILQKA
jgi:hypothetical protein